MNILYCGDSNIVDGLIISILSLIKHEKGNLNIYVFSMDYDDKKSVSEKAIEKLDKLVKEVNKDSFVKLIDVEKFFLEEMPTSNIDTLFTPYCMLRLYADLVPDIPSKILYLDNDVVAKRSFKDFYDIDNSKYELVGARDFYGQYFYSKNKIKKDYLNSTILMIEGKEVRPTEEDVDKCIAYLTALGSWICDKTVRDTVRSYKRGELNIEESLRNAILDEQIEIKSQETDIANLKSQNKGEI